MLKMLHDCRSLLAYLVRDGPSGTVHRSRAGKVQSLKRCLHWSYTLQPAKLPWWLTDKEPACVQETWDWSLAQKDPGQGNGNLWYSCLWNPMDKGAWGLQSTVLQKELDKTDYTHTHVHTHSLFLQQSYSFLLSSFPWVWNLISSKSNHFQPPLSKPKCWW